MKKNCRLTTADCRQYCTWNVFYCRLETLLDRWQRPSTVCVTDAPSGSLLTLQCFCPWCITQVVQKEKGTIWQSKRKQAEAMPLLRENKNRWLTFTDGGANDVKNIQYSARCTYTSSRPGHNEANTLLLFDFFFLYCIIERSAGRRYM